MEKIAVVVPWHDPKQRDRFLREWGNPILANCVPSFLILQHDEHHEGCAVTKNKGIVKAMEMGAEVVIVLDDDCYPAEHHSLAAFAEAHMDALEDQRVRMFQTVTDPPSRGTPYADLDITLPVAASLGFWTEIGDYCAVRQLAHQGAPMTFDRSPVFGRYFPLCGMNIAFRPAEWLPWCRFIDVPRFDDIWMGWLWQREAYRRGFCFNMHGPMVRHARQSNVWKNLEDEARYLEQSETLWREIATEQSCDYEVLRALLPI